MQLLFVFYVPVVFFLLILRAENLVMTLNIFPLILHHYAQLLEDS